MERENRKKTGGAKKRHNSPAARIAQQRRAERLAAEAQETEQRRLERQEQAAREAKRRREEKKARDSRAAREAQRRREEKKERRRLNEISDKQTRQAKQSKHRRISPDTWKRLLIMAAIVVAVVLSMVLFFRVRDVEVRGNHYYSGEEIVAAAGIADGDNLLTLSRGEIAGNIIARLPYVKTVRVTRSLPDTVVLTVTEHETNYCIRSTSGSLYLITAAGKATQEITEQEAGGYIQILEPQIAPPVIGETVSLAGTEGTQATLEALTLTLQEIENAELSKQVASVSVPSAYNISLWYGDRFDVKLGTTDQLAYKLEFLKIVVAEQKSYVTGTIDLTFDSGNEAHVMPDE